MTWALVLVAAAGCLARGLAQHFRQPPPLPPGLLLTAFPAAGAWEAADRPFNHYRAMDEDGRLLGAVVLSDSLPPAVKGYLGEIGSAVGITSGGTIVGVKVVRHGETPYYMEMIAASGLLEAFRGVDLSDPFPHIDSVSGATVSSRAIVRDIREASARTASSLFGITVPPPARPADNPWTGWETLLTAMLLALTLLAGTRGERSPLRKAVILANLAVVGFLLNTPLTISSASRVLSLNLPGPENTLLILVLLYAFISLPLQGRAYCRLVCPFGTLQQFANRLSPWQWSFPPGTAALLPGLRRLVLGFVLVAAVWFGMTGFAEVEPFFSLFSLKLSTLLWTVVIFMLTVSVFIRRFWCNALCPTGTLLSALSRAVRPGGGRTDETV